MAPELIQSLRIGFENVAEIVRILGQINPEARSRAPECWYEGRISEGEQSRQQGLV